MTRNNTKFCTDCQRNLPRAAFNKGCSRPDGLQNYCRECSRDRTYAYATPGLRELVLGA